MPTGDIELRWNLIFLGNICFHKYNKKYSRDCRARIKS